MFSTFYFGVKSNYLFHNNVNFFFFFSSYVSSFNSANHTNNYSAWINKSKKQKWSWHQKKKTEMVLIIIGAFESLFKLEMIMYDLYKYMDQKQRKMLCFCHFQKRLIFSPCCDLINMLRVPKTKINFVYYFLQCRINSSFFLLGFHVLKCKLIFEYAIAPDY